MNTTNRWLGFFVLMFLTVFMFTTGLDVWTLGSAVDGDGVGLYFLGLEINDSLPKENINLYAGGFFLASVVLALAAFAIVRKPIRVRSKAS